MVVGLRPVVSATERPSRPRISRGDATPVGIAGAACTHCGLPVPGEPDLGDKRGDAKPEVIIAHHDTMVQTGDRVIVFMPSKKQVREVEKLFQVSATFF